MSTDADFILTAGGASAYPTGQEVPITSSTTLTAAAHGGKTLEICTTVEEVGITLYSCVGITTKQKRVGIKVSAKSKRVKIYNAGTSGTDQILELWLEPGAQGTLYSTASTALGGWVWFGRGNIRAVTARRDPVTFDTGSTVGIGSVASSLRGSCCFVTGADAFAFTYEGTGDDIYAVIGTYTSDKTITLGSAQTVRSIANTCANPVVGPASGGGLVFSWREETTPKNEAVGATVNTGARTISLGTVVDVNATTTNDPSSISHCTIIPDKSTANQLWMSNNGASGCILTVMSLSGNTLTIDGDNVTTGATNYGGVIHSPAANKCVAIGFASSRYFFGYYQYSAGSVSLQWSATTGQDTSGTNEGMVALSDSKYYARVRNAGHYFEIDQTQVTKQLLFNNFPFLYSSSTSAAHSTPVQQGLPIDEDTVFINDVVQGDATTALIDFKHFAVWNSANVFDARVKMIPQNFGKFPVASLAGHAVHPTTKDILIWHYGQLTTGGNIFAIVNIFETPRN